MSEEIINQIKSNYDLICKARKEIADLKKQKIDKRSMAWADAQGTAKEKEDYVRSMVSDIDKQIDYKEANIEYMYNMVTIWNEELWRENE